MAVKLIEQREKKTIDIKVGDDVVKVYYQSPTAREWIEDESIITGAYYSDKDAMGQALADQKWNRIQAVICGWENVVDEKDQPIPYAFERLTLLMAQSKEFQKAIVDLANDIYKGIDPKNSSTPSETSSTGGESNPPNSGNSSDDAT
jgi:hypothetical protein